MLCAAVDDAEDAVPRPGAEVSGAARRRPTHGRTQLPPQPDLSSQIQHQACPQTQLVRAAHWKESPVCFNSHFSTWTWFCGYQNVTILDFKTQLFTGPMPFLSLKQKCQSTEGTTHWKSLSQ